MLHTQQSHDELKPGSPLAAEGVGADAAMLT